MTVVPDVARYGNTYSTTMEVDSFYCAKQICIARTCYGDVTGWLAGCLSIKTAKPILKLFQPPGSPIILVSSDPCADTQFQGPFSRGVKYTG